MVIQAVENPSMDKSRKTEPQRTIVVHLISHLGGCDHYTKTKEYVVLIAARSIAYNQANHSDAHSRVSFLDVSNIAEPQL